MSKIQDWAYHWKVSFNQDQDKQAQEVIFSRKTNKSVYPSLLFNNETVRATHTPKHLGIKTDNKLPLNEHKTKKTATYFSTQEPIDHF